MMFNKETETEKVNMKNIFSGNYRNEEKKETEKKWVSNSEIAIEENEKEPLENVVEKNKKN